MNPIFPSPMKKKILAVKVETTKPKSTNIISLIALRDDEVMFGDHRQSLKTANISGYRVL